MHKNEGNLFLENYLQEYNGMIARLYEIRAALEAKDFEGAKELVNTEINLKGEFKVIQQKVQMLYPEFVIVADAALRERKITKLLWQIAYCLRLGMTPLEVAKVLPTTNRSVSSQGSMLRRLGILEKADKIRNAQAS